MTAASVAEEAARRGRARSGINRRFLRLLLMIILPLVMVLAGTWWYLGAARYVSTDDAYVTADAVAVSSDVAGRVVAVDVHDNQHVTKGQLLFSLDDRPYRAAVEQAQAQLANARLQVDALRATYHQRVADLQAAQATLDYRQREFARQQNLLQNHVGTKQAFDEAQDNLATARQQVVAAQQQIANVTANLDGNPDVPTDQHPTVQQAQAQLVRAQLNLGYTEIRAPADGIVTNVDKLPVGNYIDPGQAAFSLVETDNPWIEANYKETDLTHMKVGDQATLSVDAYPGEVFHARVSSFSPGTGSVFEVLPPENTSGNWVKVVQRLPVRLVIENPDPAHPLAAGMSVTVDADTQYVNPIIARVDSFFGIGTADAQPQR